MNSLFHSLAIFFLSMIVYGEGDFLYHGRVADNWVIGEAIYATTLFTVVLKCCLVVDTWVTRSYIFIFGSFVAFFGFLPIVMFFLILVLHLRCNTNGILSIISRTIQFKFSHVE